jgi:hypothetical protein
MKAICHLNGLGSGFQGCRCIGDFHGLGLLPGSLGCLSSMRLRFLLADPVTHQWDAGSPDLRGAFRTESRAERQSHLCPERPLMPQTHQVGP